MGVKEKLVSLVLAGSLAVLAVAGCGSESDPGKSPEPPANPAVSEPLGSGPEINPQQLRPAGKGDLDGSFISVGIDGFTLPGDSRIRMTFEPRTFSADLGCNSMGGGYTIESGWFGAKTIASTAMACAEDLMEADEWLYDFLSGPLEARAGEGLLVLSDSEVTLELRPEAAAQPTIEETAWKLNSIGDSQAVSSLPSGVRPPQITLIGGSVRYRGCNSGVGRAEIRDDGFIEFGPIKLTKRSCGSEADQVEKQVMDVLRGEVAAAWEGRNLVLSRDGTSLTFVAAIA